MRIYIQSVLFIEVNVAAVVGFSWLERMEKLLSFRIRHSEFVLLNSFEFTYILCPDLSHHEDAAGGVWGVDVGGSALPLLAVDHSEVGQLGKEGKLEEGGSGNVGNMVLKLGVNMVGLW